MMDPHQTTVDSHESLLKGPIGVNSIPLSTFTSRPTGLSIQDHPGKPLRVFYLRGLVSLLVPPIVTGYYFFVWYYYLNGSPSGSPVFFGPRGGFWVYYSWFLISVIGLNLSSYGLEAIEATMMTEPKWAVDDAMLVMMHGDHSWSGPGGWWKTTTNLLRFKSAKRKDQNILPSRLWMLLAILSLPVFIALPVSGLAMNLGDGFVQTGNHPETVGFGWDTFNDRYVGDALNGAGVIWQYAFGAKIPGMGVIYTPESVDRSDSNLDFLLKLPSSLPDDGVSQIFLIPQAETPVKGESFGLAVQYNCSIVNAISDFSILRYRNGSKPLTTSQTYTAVNNDLITIYNQTDSQRNTAWARNIEAVIEIGQSVWPKNGSSFSTGPSTQCYFNANPKTTGHYPGIDDELVFEILLWQSLFTETGQFDPAPVYNSTLDSNITSLYGAYQSDSLLPMSAMGVRCTSSSAVGTAQISGLHATFSNFSATDTPIIAQTAACPSRFGPGAIGSMFDNIFATEWLSAMFSSVSAPPAFYAQFAGDDPGSGGILQLSMLQADQLRTSMLRAHAAYAVQLMYNGGQGYSSVDGTHGATFTHPNLTAYEAATVFQGGVVPPVVAAVLLLIWAVGSFALACWYGFRPRWAATLDGYGLFVFGADLGSEIERRGGLGASLAAEDSAVLRDLPGMVGDREGRGARGKIGLVDKRDGEMAKGRGRRKYV